ncbi:MAG: glycosyltransferase family 4 protein [Rhizobiaceae bacterium]
MATPKNSSTILQVVPSLHTGGVEKTTLDIGNALVEQGWTSLVASSGGRMVEKLVADGSAHFELPLDRKNPYSLWRNASKLAKLIRQENVGLIHARSRAPAWSALLAAKTTGIPFVTTYHGAYSQNNALKGWYNSVMARADRVIANSQWTADLILERNPWARERIVTIHRGTDFTAFYKSAITQERKEKLTLEWDIQPNQFTVVHMARLTKWKGQTVVIAAAARLAKKYPNLRFILAGDSQGRDEYHSTLKQEIANQGLEKHVLVAGHCFDPAAAMAVADVVIVASVEAEAFGRAAVEAGALEKPVIVTRIGAVGETVLALPEVTLDQATGWKVPPGNDEEMAKALSDLIEMSPTQRDSIGARGRIHCEANFSLSQMCNKTLSLYQQLLE